jgi:hypothetical protein
MRPIAVAMTHTAGQMMQEAKQKKLVVVQKKPAIGLMS